MGGRAYSIQLLLRNAYYVIEKIKAYSQTSLEFTIITSVMDGNNRGCEEQSLL